MFHVSQCKIRVLSAGSNIKIVLLRLFFYFKSAYGMGVAHVIQEVGPEVAGFLAIECALVFRRDGSPPGGTGAAVGPLEPAWSAPKTSRRADRQ